ncbi:hypothetical protein IC607_09380 [Cellulomonas sp. JH27-2]|uniref:hypothetical protein n=1 Tax=Cellulomonas sp. JH27-2 TaxID=2774139 RepID=UPI00177E7EBC|nr:hypothetical protein [Cellulomonas sp. JH27-2]MBD8059177.1 hypothetical protein [Cellulomonas sp. JH27-2]
MRRTLAPSIGPLILGLTLVTGCSSSDTPSSSDRVDSTATTGTTSSQDSSKNDAAEVTIGSVGFVADDMLPTAYAVVDNPTKDIASIEVNFAAYDKSGDVVATETTYVIARSGSKMQVATYVSVPEDSKVDKVDAQVNVSDSQADDHPESKMTAKKVKVHVDEFSSTATGTIDSTYEQSVTNVEAVAICTDKSGKTVGAGSTYLDGKVVPGTPAPFEIPLSVDGKPTACTVTAGLSSLSEGS